MVGTSLLTMICVSAVFLQNMMSESERQVENYRQTLTADVESSLKNETQVAISVIQQVYEKQKKGELTEAQARKEAADRVRELRYDEGKGYFWIDTYEGVNVVLLGRDTEGKSRINSVDPSGRYFIKEMIENGRKAGGGFTDLMFAKPNETEPLPKRNYTATFEPYQWVLGTGVWIDDIDVKVAAEKEQVDSAFWSSLIKLMVFVVVMEAIFVGLAVLSANKIVAPISRVTERLSVLATGDFRPKSNDSNGAHADCSTPPVDGGERTDIGNPLLNEVGRHVLHRQAEQVLDLCGEDGQGNTRGKTHHNRIRDVLDDGAKVQDTEQDEEHTRQECGDGQPLEAVLLDDTIYNNNERARRATYLNLRSAENGNHKSCHDGSDNPLLRGDT